MGTVVLVLGASGSGKSYSLRHFEPGTVGVFSVAGKPLPFGKRLDTARTRSYLAIAGALEAGSMDCYVIDDANYLMQFENFERIEERGYDKFAQMARNFERLLDCAIFKTGEDTTVYFLMHPEWDDGLGRIKPKTIGKMLDNQLTIEGLVVACLVAKVDAEGYRFVTNGDPASPAKCPPEMGLPQVIDNDLADFDRRLRELYGMRPLGGGQDE